jgi:hypothetical protein
MKRVLKFTGISVAVLFSLALVRACYLVSTGNVYTTAPAPAAKVSDNAISPATGGNFVEVSSTLLEDKLIIDKCIRDGTVVRCRFHMVKGNGFPEFADGYRFGAKAFRFDGPGNMVALPGAVAAVPDLYVGGSADIRLLVPEDAELVWLTYHM